MSAFDPKRTWVPEFAVMHNKTVLAPLNGPGRGRRVMRRREFVTALGAATLALQSAARAQQHTRPLIGWLSPHTQAYSDSKAAVFLQALRELGYVEGKDFDIVYRTSGGNQDRLPALAQELVQLKPDVILACAIAAVIPAKKLTSTIPIVSAALADAVHLGVIASEARPGGNVTGIEPYVAGLPAKQLEVAREIVPEARTLGLLTNSVDPKAPPQLKEIEAASQGIEIKLVAKDANHPNEVEGALQFLAEQKADVVIVLQTSMLISQTVPIAESAIAKRLPTVYGYREHVVDGGLISYGVDLRWCYQRAAALVVKILHGTPPGDIPVEFPTSVMLSINVRTAKLLGLTVPPSLLARADEVIE
jgi:putative tryptophan/tyrosine transport system substrate-binding protein